jgi:hypothetical protein
VTFSLAFIALVFVLWRLRPSGEDKRVRLYEMMRLRRVPPPGDACADPDVAAAERRCVACASKALCDESMRAGDDRAYSRFCPNAIYIEWLRSASLQFD